MPLDGCVAPPPWACPPPPGEKRHRLREVTAGRRSLCSIKSCGNDNARLGCLTCNLYLCSPECVEAHLYDNPELRPRRGAIQFNDVSTMKEKGAARGKHARRDRDRCGAPAESEV